MPQQLTRTGDENTNDIDIVIQCANCLKVLSDPLEIYGAPHLEQCANCFFEGLEPSDGPIDDLERELGVLNWEISSTEDQIEDLEDELEELENEKKKLEKKIADRKGKL